MQENNFQKIQRKRAWYRGKNLRKFPCVECGLFLCICNSNLIDWQEPKTKIRKNKCIQCKLYLCDCPRDFKGELKIGDFCGS